VLVFQHVNGQGGNGAMIGGAPIAELARWLDQWVGRPVIDETNLRGNFDAVIAFQAGILPWQTPSAARPDAAPGNRPGIHLAVEEQLGLKLEARRAPAPTLVIDTVQRPGPD
jgi:uncharacterized protein (TIGR03435 family)